jgi:DNA-binding NarL/FixJ family response regulator
MILREGNPGAIARNSHTTSKATMEMRNNFMTTLELIGRSAEEEEPLSIREVEVLLCLCTGASNQAIADKLCISPHTVKTHLYSIYQKLNVNSRLNACLWAYRNGGAYHERNGLCLNV